MKHPGRGSKWGGNEADSPLRNSSLRFVRGASAFGFRLRITRIAQTYGPLGNGGGEGGATAWRVGEIKVYASIVI